MAINDVGPTRAKIALFDGASTHTILRNQDFLFSHKIYLSATMISSQLLENKI